MSRARPGRERGDVPVTAVAGTSRWPVLALFRPALAGMDWELPHCAGPNYRHTTLAMLQTAEVQTPLWQTALLQRAESTHTMVPVPPTTLERSWSSRLRSVSFESTSFLACLSMYSPPCDRWQTAVLEAAVTCGKEHNTVPRAVKLIRCSLSKMAIRDRFTIAVRSVSDSSNYRTLTCCHPCPPPRPPATRAGPLRLAPQPGGRLPWRSPGPDDARVGASDGLARLTIGERQFLGPRVLRLAGGGAGDLVDQRHGPGQLVSRHASRP